jgi:hypothetical protein
MSLQNTVNPKDQLLMRKINSLDKPISLFLAKSSDVLLIPNKNQPGLEIRVCESMRRWFAEFH